MILPDYIDGVRVTLYSKEQKIGRFEEHSIVSNVDGSYLFLQLGEGRCTPKTLIKLASHLISQEISGKERELVSHQEAALMYLQHAYEALNHKEIRL